MKAASLTRWARVLFGLSLFGFGIALMVRSNLGLGPWEVLSQGVARQLGFPIGMVSIVVGVLILLAWLPLGERPGRGTLLNVLVIGVSLDLILLVLPSAAGPMLGTALLLSGILAMGIGAGLYLGVDLGFAGPRDGLMLGLARCVGWSIRRTRTSLEVTVMVCGWLLGGTVGVGTLVFAFSIGPLVQTALRIFGHYGRHPS